MPAAPTAPPPTPGTAGVRVRAATTADLDAMLALYAHLHANDAPLPARARVEATWATIVKSPHFHCFVAERPGRAERASPPIDQEDQKTTSSRLLASCTMTVVPNLTRGARPYAVIENVVTRRRARRQGFGTAVLRHAQRVAWARGCYKVMLLTSATDPGTLAFYEGAGFQRGVKTGFLARPPGE